MANPYLIILVFFIISSIATLWPLLTSFFKIIVFLSTKITSPSFKSVKATTTLSLSFILKYFFIIATYFHIVISLRAIFELSFPFQGMPSAVQSLGNLPYHPLP